MDIKIAPSVLACDLSRLAEETLQMAAAGAHMIHLDVMDGHFVPNISFGAPLIKSLRNKTNIHFDTHLMIAKPLDYVKDFMEAGSDTVTFHIEAESDVYKTIDTIKQGAVKAGLSLKPATPAEAVFPYLRLLDQVLVMTVEPGFGGQQFMAEMCPKITKIRKEIARLGLDTDIQVDGGIDAKTAPSAAAAGANVFVAGSSLYGKKEYKQAVALLYAACIENFETF